MSDYFIEQLQVEIKQLQRRVTNMDRRLLELEGKVGILPPKQEAPAAEFKKAVPIEKKFNWHLFELNIGTYLLQIIGVSIFLLGMGFLLKYSIEREWLSPIVRIAFGLISATILINMGEWIRTRYKQWSLAGIAGGIVLYYLSIYAAFNFYQFISLHQTLIMFALITVLSGFLSWWHDSLFIAWFSLIGGFLTPLLLPQLIEPSLRLVYLALLALCYVMLSYGKNWFSLGYGSLLFMIYFGLYAPLPSNYNLFFVGVTWLIFIVLPYLYVLIKKPKSRPFEAMLIGLASVYDFWTLFVLLKNPAYIAQAPWLINWLLSGLNIQATVKYMWIVFAVIYGAMLALLYGLKNKNRAALSTLYAIFVMSMVGLILNLWTGYICDAALTILALILFVISFLVKEPHMRIPSYIIWLFSTVYLCIVRYNAISFKSTIFNKINGSMAIVFASFAIAAWLSGWYKKQLLKEESWVPTLLEGAALSIVIFWLHTQVWQRPFYIMGLMGFAFIVFVIGLFGKRKLMRQFAYAATGLALIYFWWFYIMHNLVNPYWSIRLNMLFISFIVSFAFARGVLSFVKKCNTKEYEICRICLDMLLALFVFAWIRANIILHLDVLKMEGTLFANRLVGYSLQQDTLVRTGFTNVILALFYTIYSILLISIGLIKKNRPIRYLGLAIIILALKKLIEVILQMPDTMQRIVAFLVVGALLIAASFLYQRMRKRID
jgi:Predicted membrane protein (DUF2339)